MAILSFLGRRRLPRGRTPDAAVPFALVCPCGHAVEGVRRPTHQFVICPQCGQNLFVLPRSPWPPVGVELLSGKPPAGAPLAARFWRMPLLAGGATLAATVVLLASLLSLLLRPAADDRSGRPTADELHARAAAGKRALAAGKFKQALQELDAARALRDRQPALLSAEESRALDQLHRQCDLLARQLGVPLQEIVKEASLTPAEEWPARFATEYHGKAVLFDDTVRLDATGRPLLSGYEVRVGAEPARVALDDLRLLRRLPLDPPQRLLFGARLARVGREGGEWVIRFEPASGVLLTDADAAGCVPLDEPLRRVLERQAEWLRTLRLD